MAPHSKARSRRGHLLLEVPLALVFAALGVYLSLRHSMGDGGILLLKDHEVMVRVDNLSGELQADDRPGAHTSLPWLEALHRLDRRPLRYVMGTGSGEVDRTAPNLVVRGRDGANYGFGLVELQVALDPALADVALVDNGGDREMILRLVDAYARPALRDAFGRYTPREIVLPEVKQAGTAAALEDLQGTLARHGVRVLELSVSKPIFEPKYQEVIHRRKVAEQDTERLVREEQELVATADARARAVEDIEERKLVQLRRDLSEQKRLAERAALELRESADREATDTLAAARLERDERVARAEVIEARHRAEAEAFATRLAALESQGELAVRAALVERLSTITFDLVPVSDDPERVQRTTRGGVE